MTRQSLVNHAKSASHQLAVRMEADFRLSRRDGGITMALDKVVSAVEESLHWSLEVHVFFNKERDSSQH